MHCAILRTSVVLKDTPVVTAAGELNYLNCESLQDVIDYTMRESGYQAELDLSGLEYVDSSGLRVLAKAALNARESGGFIGIRSISAQLVRMLDLSGLRDLFEFVPDPVVSEGPAHQAPSSAMSCAFRVPASPEAACRARSRICEFALSSGMDALAVEDLRLGVGEAISNAIRHGAQEGGELNITCSAENGEFVVKLVYPSEPFDPDAIPVPDMAHGPTGGMGIYFLRMVMSSVEYQFIDGKAIVTMTKRAGSTTARPIP